MGDSFQYGDLFFLGLIAVFVALRLRAMLGRNTGIDPQEMWKNASRTLKPDAPTSLSPEALVESVKQAAKEEETIASMSSNPSVSASLVMIKKVDASFNVMDFLAGAKLAFEWLIEAFTEGNKDKLRVLLSAERFQHFADEIDARATETVKHQTTLVAINSADITDMQIVGSRVQITVTFISEQMHVTRDKTSNEVIGDGPSAIEKVTDVWTFERDTTSRDPNWKIVGT